MFHVYSHADPVCGFVVTDEEYPRLAAHRILRKVVDEFVSKYPRSAYDGFTKESPKMSFPELKDYIQRYQNPENADSTMKIQKELDETKIVLHNTIQSVLERGEKIDDLVQKSEGLSAQSKMFYTQVGSRRMRMATLTITDMIHRLKSRTHAATSCEDCLALMTFLSCWALIPGFHS